MIKIQSKRISATNSYLLFSKFGFGLLALTIVPLLFLAGCSDDDPVATHQTDEVTILVSPTDGATNVPASAVFSVTFDRAMERSHTESVFMLHQGWGVGGMTRPGTFSWDQQGKIMSFHPASPLDSGATFTLHLMGMMRGMDGMGYHPILDTMRMGGGVMSGRMMGGMVEDEIRVVCSTGPTIRRQLDLDLVGDLVYVADGRSGDIAVIDPTTYSLLAVQPVENIKFLHHVSLSPDRTKLIVSDADEDMSSGGSGGHGGHGGMVMGRSQIIILDSRTLLELNRIEIEGIVHNGRVTPNGQTLLFNNADHNMLHRYSFPALVSQSSYSVGAGPLEVTVTPNGEYALTANSGNGTVNRIHLTMDMPADVLSVGQTPVGAWITPNGRTAWVNNEGSKSVTILTISPFAVDTTIVLGFTPGQAIVNPNRGEAYVADEDNGKIVVIDTRTYARLSEITTGAGAHGITFAPDGSRAFVTNEHAMSVSVINTETRTVIATVNVGMMPNGIVYRAAL